MFGKIEILRRLIDVDEILVEQIEDIPELQLTESQKKLILHLVNKSEHDKPYEYIGINFDDFCNLFKIKKNDDMFEKINTEIKDLSYKIFLIPVMNIRPRRMCMWVVGGHIDYEKDAIYFKLSDTFRPYYKYLKNQLNI